MKGVFDLKLINNRGKGDQYFQDAINGGYIMEALDDLPIVGRCPKEHNHNMIFDNYAYGVLHDCFSSGNSAHGYWDEIFDDANHAALSFIQLSNTSSLPTYTEDASYQNYYDMNHSALTGYVSSSGSKRFIEDDITAPTIWSDTAREAIHFRNRFLYLPSQGNSNSIKSVAIWAQNDGDKNNTSYAWLGKIGRVRLRDSDGVLTTLNKTSSNSLLVEYTFTHVTW